MSDYVIERGPLTIELPSGGIPAGFTIKFECGGQQVIIKQSSRTTAPIPPENQQLEVENDTNSIL